MASFRSSRFLYVGILVALLGPPAHAASLILRDGNAMFQIDPYSQAGMSAWEQNGVNFMPQQWLWYRTGGAASEASIDSLALLGAEAQNFFGNPGPNSASIAYQNDNLAVSLLVDLVGGTRSSSVVQAVNWTNRTADPMNLTVFLYVHFTLSPSDVIRILGNGTIRQSGAGNQVEMVMVPSGGTSAAGTFSSLRDSLNDSALTTLSGPATSSGDVEGVVRWDVQLGAAGGQASTFQLSITESLMQTPEPGSLWMAAGALGVVLLLRSRRRFRMSRR